MTARWIDRLERRIGLLAIPGLAAFLTGMNAAVGLMSLFKPEFPARLDLDPFLLRHGELWRALTFLFVPPNFAPIWLFFWIVLFYAYASRLEAVWGDFKFTLYCALGAAGTLAAACLTDEPTSNAVFQSSLFLAFARLDPDFEVLLFFFFPVKLKWLALAAWIMIALAFVVGGHARIDYALGLINYFVFFAPDIAYQAKMLLRRLRR